MWDRDLILSSLCFVFIFSPVFYGVFKFNSWPCPRLASSLFSLLVPTIARFRWFMVEILVHPFLLEFYELTSYIALGSLLCEASRRSTKLGSVSSDSYSVLECHFLSAELSARRHSIEIVRLRWNSELIRDSGWLGRAARCWLVVGCGTLQVQGLRCNIYIRPCNVCFNRKVNHSFE